MDRDSLDAGIGTITEDLRSAAGFLTRLPSDLFGASAHVRPDFSRAARVFPLIGAAIGVVGGAALVAGNTLGLPPLVSATLAIAGTAALTGAMHEDGLADTADSFGGTTVERRLEIMTDSRVGTFGMVALVLLLLLRVGALAAIVSQGVAAAVLALIAGEAVSRAAMVAQWHVQPPAKKDGLARATGRPSSNATLTALTIAAAIVLIATPPGIGLSAGFLGGALAAIGSYSIAIVTMRAIGGHTGDTLGACQQVAAACFLLGAATTL